RATAGRGHVAAVAGRPAGPYRRALRTAVPMHRLRGHLFPPGQGGLLAAAGCDAGPIARPDVAAAAVPRRADGRSIGLTGPGRSVPARIRLVDRGPATARGGLAGSRLALAGSGPFGQPGWGD